MKIKQIKPSVTMGCKNICNAKPFIGRLFFIFVFHK